MRLSTPHRKLAAAAVAVTAMAATAVVATAPASNAAVRVVGCAVTATASDGTASGTMTATLNCNGNARLTGVWTATASWTDAIGMVTLSGPDGTFSGSCAVTVTAPPRTWAWDCTVSGGGRTLTLRWQVAEAAVAIAGTGSITEITPSGVLCGFTSVTDPTVENGQTQTGEIDGGPVGDPSKPAATVTLTCTIQVGAANGTHAGADAVSLSGTGTGVATVGGAATYISPEGQPVFMCSQVTVNGTTYYWDDAAGDWSFSSSAPCSEAIQQEIFPGPLAPVIDLLCPILALIFPPEGDIVLPSPIGTLIDCPPVA